jgi:acetoin utilization deacetylase AcuC-like enzyme
MKFFHCDRFNFFLPPDHRFPIRKYARLRERVEREVPGAVLIESAPAADADLLRVHTPDYLQKLKDCTLTEKEQRRLGFPWSPQLLERSRRSVGGTMAACRAALEEGRAMNLAGGTHHAYADHGEGFCVFNDVAIAARTLQAEGRAARLAVIDCDVHQGNGTAAILAGDDAAFTLSIHAANNFPLHKESSDLDLELPDGTGDHDYLEAVEYGVQRALRLSKPDLAVYLAGADPWEGDTLGRLKVSKDGLAARDRLVFEHCARAGVPVAVVLSGGYAKNVEDTVDIHLQTAKAGDQ